ncbi:MAG: UDP-2,3-diacylglucosamine diphosphatase [Gallionellaceae bacterium]|jgi:UDP-2,3-diacylglucosamine hydrolase|nr:UDP-2,3-diacylglucosamine diphosphatase [Gallionellaceae bacterium]
MHTLFISDLHLSADRPHITGIFLRFLRETAPQAEALYILGDLFDYWVGDDDLGDALHEEVTGALRALADGGVKIHFMHGNRDLLIAEKFAAASQAALLPDPTLIHLYGTPTLLTHGDALCTDDTAYQAFRAQVRNPEVQRQFLARPLAQRRQEIAQMRAASEAEKRHKTAEIMDVNDDAVKTLLREYGYPRLIHGHTHRPGCTVYQLDGHACERWVMGEWGARGNALRCERNACRAIEFD